MEQLLIIANNVTTIVGAILCIIGMVALVYVLVLCVKFNRLMKQVTTTAESIQQLSQFPLQVVNSLLQKLLGPSE